MTIDRWGHIEGFTPAVHHSTVIGNVDKPVEGGEKARRRRLRNRLVVDGERTYYAYSADELLEIDSIANHGRPGLPY